MTMEPELFNSIMGLQACFDLIKHLYDFLYDNTESFEQEPELGSDFTYLIGAICHNTSIITTTNSPLVTILRTESNSDSFVPPQVWNYIRFEEGENK